MALFTLGLAVALAQPAAAESTAGVFPYAVHSEVLENGLTVHVIPMPSEGVAACYTWMKVGSRDETDPGRTGFAHFFEHLMFYGTQTVGREAREREILLLGADENAWTWFDETVYHAVLANTQVPKYLALEADRFQHLYLTEEDVRREAGAVFGEYRKGQSDPDSRLWETLFANAFSTHTYHHDTIGFEADIAAMPTAWEYSQAFFSRFYRPENATILVVGDVEPAEVFAEVRKNWSSWPTGTQSRPALPEEPKQTALRRAEVLWPGPTATRIAFGWRIPADRAANPEVAALSLVAEMLTSPVGPLSRRLIDEEGLAYALEGARNPFFDPSLLTLTLTLKDPKHLARAEAIVREEVAKLQTAVDPDYLAQTRSHSRYDFLSGLDDPDSVASAFGWAMRRNGTVDALDTYYRHYDAQTPEGVASAAQKYLVDEGLTVVVLKGASEAQ